MTWDGITASWWSGEVASDPAYRADVDPLLQSLLGDAGGRVLDIGCGDGRLMAGRPWVGIDPSLPLLRSVADGAQVVCGDGRRLPFADGAFDGVVMSLVLEHVPEAEAVLHEAGRVVAAGGFLCVVVNHPLYTAPGSGPFLDPEDGEVLWRWGGYLEEGFSDEPAGEGSIRFHHRPLGALLTAAAEAGWSLDALMERPLSDKGDPLLAAQRRVPRLLGGRWTRRGPEDGPSGQYTR